MTKLTRVHNYYTLREAVNDFLLDEIYRFQETSDPDEESILFAISSPMHYIKGLVINSFGANFDYRSSKLVEHLYKKSRQ